MLFCNFCLTGLLGVLCAVPTTFLDPRGRGWAAPGSPPPLLHPSDLPAPTCEGFGSISPTACKCIVLRGYTHTHTSSLIYIDLLGNPALLGTFRNALQPQVAHLNPPFCPPYFPSTTPTNCLPAPPPRKLRSLHKSLLTHIQPRFTRSGTCAPSSLFPCPPLLRKLRSLLPFSLSPYSGSCASYFYFPCPHFQTAKLPPSFSPVSPTRPSAEGTALLFLCFAMLGRRTDTCLFFFSLTPQKCPKPNLQAHCHAPLATPTKTGGVCFLKPVVWNNSALL